jgi:hypothetical protein
MRRLLFFCAFSALNGLGGDATAAETAVAGAGASFSAKVYQQWAEA